MDSIEQAKIKKAKAEMEIARILENLELETGLKTNIVYVYRENIKSEPLSQPKECIRIDIAFDAMSKYRYREVKNYIHNELKLTKEDIKEIMIPIVKEEVKRIFHNTYGNDVDIERWVRCMVSNEIQRHGDYSMIRNLCREIIKEEIADRLSIDISLKKKEG